MEAAGRRVRKIGPASPAVGDAAALLSSIVWGCGFVVTRLLLAELTPLAVLLLRFGLAAWAYLALLALTQGGRPRLPRRSLGRLWFVALAGTTLNTLGVTVSIGYVGAGTSSLVIMLVPLLTGLLAVLTGQERFSARRLQGLLVALAGLMIVVLLGGSGASFAGTQVVGLLLLLAGAFGFAVYNVFSRPLFRHYSPLEVSAYVGILAALGQLSLLLIEPVRADLAAAARLSAGGWLLLGYLALLANVTVFLTWYWALRRLPASRVALFSYLIPVWAVTSAAIVLHERITVWLPVGVALVVAGIAIANRSPRRPAR